MILARGLSGFNTDKNSYKSELFAPKSIYEVNFKIRFLSA